MSEFFADSPDERTRVRGPWMLASMALLVLVIFVTVILPTALSALGRKKAPVLGYEVVATYPHDAAAFTQGLVIDKGELFESTGLFGESTLRKVDLETGRVLQSVALPSDVFGEGMCIIDDRIYMVTWRKRLGYVFDRDTFTLLDTWTYTGEGWGLATDGEELMLSNGTPTIQFFDPLTLQPVMVTDSRGRPRPKVVRVREGFRTFEGLNELEYINNEIWANVYGRDTILRISPKTGELRGQVDFSDLFPRKQRPDRDSVFNGIAFDRATQKIYVTGKRWPTLYEVRVVEPKARGSQ